MSDDSASLPSVSPPVLPQQPPPPPSHAHLRPTAPKLARVSSDPVRSHHPSSSSASTSTPLLFQNQPAPLPTGNRPAGASLPSHPPPSQTPDMASSQAGPSTSTVRSTRYANPDSHWLSEDEGESFVDDMRHNRQSPRRRGGPRLHSNYPPDAFDDHHDGNGKNSDRDGPNGGGGLAGEKRRSRQASLQQDLFIDSSLQQPVQPSSLISSTAQSHQTLPADAPRSTRQSESISVKNDIEPNPAYRDFAPYIKDLSSITPNLLKALTCPSCHKLMNDPTTLACGHSECLLCVAPKAASVLLRKTSPTSPPIAITAAVLTTDEGNRFQDSTSSPSPPLETAHSNANHQFAKNNRAASLADGICPVSSCRKVTKATSGGRQGLRVDVVLQKVASLLKTRVLASDDENDTSEITSTVINAPVPQRRSSPIALLDSASADLEEEGSLSEPLLYRSSPSFGHTHNSSGPNSPPRLSRSRSHLRTSPPAFARHSADSLAGRVGSSRERGPSNTSSPDEETKSDETSKRSMKSKTHSRAGRSIKKSRGTAGTSLPASQAMHAKRNAAALPMLVTDVLSELECHICVTLIYQPLTTQCGHTFCKKCLLRSLDHSNRCPLCRSELPGISHFVRAPINFTLSNLLVTTFPLLYEQRGELQKQEETESGLDTPIFVCMVSFPFMPTNLHIYEPRYRLMMRRAMEGNKRFGMVLPSRQAGSGGFAQYGTMLEIKNMHTFEDGRSMIETVGVSRFKILESGTLDGYTVGKIERIDDIGDEEEEELERMALARSTARLELERGAAQRASSSSSNLNQPADEKATSPGQASSTPSSRPSTATRLRSLSFSRHRSVSIGNGSNNGNGRSPSAAATAASSSQAGIDPAAGTTSSNPNDASALDSMELTNDQLVEVCKGFVEALRTGSTPWLLQRLNSSLPPMPDDPREFSWWMAMLMPIDDHEKARLLQVGTVAVFPLQDCRSTRLGGQKKLMLITL